MIEPSNPPRSSAVRYPPRTTMHKDASPTPRVQRMSPAERNVSMRRLDFPWSRTRKSNANAMKPIITTSWNVIPASSGHDSQPRAPHHNFPSLHTMILPSVSCCWAVMSEFVIKPPPVAWSPRLTRSQATKMHTSFPGLTREICGLVSLIIITRIP